MCMMSLFARWVALRFVKLPVNSLRVPVFGPLNNQSHGPKWQVWRVSASPLGNPAYSTKHSKRYGACSKHPKCVNQWRNVCKTIATSF